MRFIRMLRAGCLVAAALLPQLVFAANPPDPRTLGAVQAVYDFCGKVGDNRDRDRDKVRDRGHGSDEHGRQIFRGMSEREVESARKSGDYQRAYNQITAVLLELDHDAAARACKAV